MTPDETDVVTRLDKIEERLNRLEQKVLGDADRFIDEELKTYGFR